MLTIQTSRALVLLPVLWCSAVSICAQDAQPELLNWHTELAAAKTEAAATGKPIFLEFRCAP